MGLPVSPSIMTFAPLFFILITLVVGTIVTLAFLYVAQRSGQFRDPEKGATVIFDEEGPAEEGKQGQDRETTESKDSTTEQK
jgi:cbb3-type cytochrome oxidase maturation protein